MVSLNTLWSLRCSPVEYRSISKSIPPVHGLRYPLLRCAARRDSEFCGGIDPSGFITSIGQIGKHETIVKSW